jgi:hypothetical protein
MSFLPESEWNHAVRCSYQALEDEKTIHRELDVVWERTCPLSREQRGKAVSLLYGRLEEVQKRIVSWQEWFKKYETKPLVNPCDTCLHGPGTVCNLECFGDE